PNVVSGLELSRDEQGYYLVCEWLDCVSLAEAHERLGPLPWPVVVAVGEARCDALCYLHGLSDADGAPAPLIHRDITPANVLLTRGGEVKLADFGVATCLGGAQAEAKGSVQLCEVGTPGFRAPEQG